VLPSRGEVVWRGLRAPLSMLLSQPDSQDSILHYVANAVESLGSSTAEGIFLDDPWQDVRLPGCQATGLPAVINAEDGPTAAAPYQGGRLWG
jgi:hypothetical protein